MQWWVCALGRFLMSIYAFKTTIWCEKINLEENLFIIWARLQVNHKIIYLIITRCWFTDMSINFQIVLLASFSFLHHWKITFLLQGNYCMHHVRTRNFDLRTMGQDISQWEKKQGNLRSYATWILLVSFSPMWCYLERWS